MLYYNGREGVLQMRMLVNSITAFRIAAGVAVFYLVVFGYWPIAFCLVILGELSDLIDGPIARKFNVTTSDGKLFDLFADIIFDELVVFALLVVEEIPMPIWITMALVIVVLRLPAIFEKKWLWIPATIVSPIHGLGMIWLIVKYYSVNAIGSINTAFILGLVIPASLVIVYWKRERIVSDLRKARQSFVS